MNVEQMAMDRRTLMGRALMLVGATLAANMPLPVLAQSEDYRPTLAAADYRLLGAVADTLVPRGNTVGALDCGVPASVDALLVNWASAERREQIIAALRVIDTLARTQHGSAFADLSPDARTAMLGAHDAAALRVAAAVQPGSLVQMMRGPAYVDPGYAKLKEIIVILFYTSQPALTHELSYVHAPGAWQPSVPVTADTKPAVGGMF